MKLVLVADAFPPLRTSAAVQLRDLSREFVSQGHELTVLLPAHNLTESWDLTDYHGVRVLRLAAPRTKDVGYVRRTVAEWLMPYSMKRNLKKSPLASENWDGVIWYSPSIFHAPLIHALKQGSGSRSYLIIRDIFPEWALDLGLLRPGLAYAFLKRVARQQYEAADIIGVQSPGNLAYFAPSAEACADKKLEVLQNWLSPPVNVPCSLRINSTPVSGRRIFVYAGNMGVAQDLDILIELADRLRQRKDIGFLFVGRGSETERLKAAAQQLALENVLFHPEIDPDEIPELYSQCAAGIVSLNKRHKSHNIPGKFLTYMQNGLPVIAIVNRGNDLAEIVQNEGVGFVCESHELEDVSGKVVRLLEQIETDPTLPLRCRKLFERHFSVSRSVQQIVSALQRPFQKGLDG